MRLVEIFVSVDWIEREYSTACLRVSASLQKLYESRPSAVIPGMTPA
jgi:hypothetical protein